MEYYRLAESLERESREPQLRLLDLGNLVNMLQADGADRLFPRITRPFSLLLSAERDLRCIEEKPGGVRCADFEVERAVRADSDLAWHRRSGVDVLCPSVELLHEAELVS